MDDKLNVTADFYLNDYRCKCGCNTLLVNDNFCQLIDKVQNTRSTVKTPLVIDSAFRCAAHNAAVGGKPNSRHLLCDAADIRFVDPRLYTADGLATLRAAMIECGFTGIGVDPYSFFVHGDSGEKREWTYDQKGQAISL